VLAEIEGTVIINVIHVVGGTIYLERTIFSRLRQQITSRGCGDNVNDNRQHAIDFRDRRWIIVLRPLSLQ
jgi:hypothetical protein